MKPQERPGPSDKSATVARGGRETKAGRAQTVVGWTNQSGELYFLKDLDKMLKLKTPQH